MKKIIQETAERIKLFPDKVIIGISGHGASGKTTFAKKLLNLLDGDANYLNTDPYILTDVRKYTTIDYEYNNEQHSYKMTACHPAAHDLLALKRDVEMIRMGLDFYTIDTPYLRSTLISATKSVNIVEGMSVAFLNPSLFDVMIYLYTDGETELSRRGIRDVAERGRNREGLLRSHHQRRIQYELFMHPNSEQFDVVIKNSDTEVTVEKDRL